MSDDTSDDPMVHRKVYVRLPVHGGSVVLSSASGEEPLLGISLHDEEGASVAWDLASARLVAVPIRLTRGDVVALEDLLRRYAASHPEAAP